MGKLHTAVNLIGESLCATYHACIESDTPLLHTQVSGKLRSLCRNVPSQHFSSLTFLFSSLRNGFLFGLAILGAVAWRSLDPAFILGADSDDVDEEIIELPATASSTQDSAREKAEKLRVQTSVDVDLTREALMSPLERVQSVHSINLDEPGSRDNLLPRSTKSTPKTTPSDHSSATFPSPTSPSRSKYGAWRDAAT